MNHRLLFVLSAMVVTNAAALAAELQDSMCKATGGWLCQDQGDNICAKLQAKNNECEGDCYVCLGGQIPAKMCFDEEGSTCTPAGNVDCGPKYDGTCQTLEGGCSCVFGGVPNGNCTFSSCN